ncbi:MAG: phospho-N-acetylmuramoyl-pentapeptide-transferase [Chlamydiales bacterium]|nr:phospho-N-acetylmuramoyl-pentapeptide-transferase [Chlamydiales bacterium]
MIYWLTEFLRTDLGWHVPAVFGYTSTRVILAALTSLLFCLLAGPYFIRKLYELKIGQPIREADGFLLGDLHKSKKNTPTMGGILMIASMLLSLVLWMDLRNTFTLILFSTTIVLGLLGGYDDFLKLYYKNPKGLSAKKKLGVQLVWALLVAAYLQMPSVSTGLEMGSWFDPPVVKEFFSDVKLSQTLTLKDYSSRLYVPFFKEPIYIFSGIGLLFMWGFYAFVIVGSSNAVNLTDGLDGLATGLCMFVAGALGMFAFLANNQDLAHYLNILYVEGSGEIAIYMAAICGACLGFLWFNCHPAQLFMGDIGSLTLGGLLGVTAVLIKREFFLGLVGAIFVVEALSVIMQVTSYKLRDKKRIFLCAPLHHHFEYKGWPESKVVIRFWIIGLLLSLIGLASIKFQ